MKLRRTNLLPLIAVLLFILLIPMGVSAKDLDLEIDGFTVTDEDAPDVFGDGTVCYDYKASKLTLNNACLDGWVEFDAYGYGMVVGNALDGGSDMLTIELIGTNYINCPETQFSNWGLYAFNSRTLRFTGSGTLYVRGGDSSDGATCGITCGALIMDGGTVVVQPGTANVSSNQVGVRTGKSSLIRGGTLICDSGSHSGPTIGLLNENGIDLSGGCLVATSPGQAISVEPSFGTYYPSPNVSYADDYFNTFALSSWDGSMALASPSVKTVRIMPASPKTVKRVNIEGLTYPKAGEVVDLSARADTASVVAVFWHQKYEGSYYELGHYSIFPKTDVMCWVLVVPPPGSLFAPAEEFSATLFGKDANVYVSGDGKKAMIILKNDIDLSFWNMPFIDVSKSEYYYEPVLWAYNTDPQITAGTDEIRFSPGVSCTRAQAVTFLWRAAGCPEPMSSYNPFYDVPKDQFYTKAVLWAVEEGITVGTGATTFNPKGICSRAQIVCFLYRMEGSPSVYYINPFVDVSASDYFYTAVLWAANNKITTGTDATHFSPNKDCKRGQIVTFLCRYCGPVG